MNRSKTAVKALVAAAALAIPVGLSMPAQATTSQGCTVTPVMPYANGDINASGIKLVDYDVNVSCSSLVPKHPRHPSRCEYEIGRAALEDLAAQARTSHRVQGPPGGERDPDVGWQPAERLHRARLGGWRHLAQIVDADVLGQITARDLENIFFVQHLGQLDAAVICRAVGAVRVEVRGLAIAGGCRLRRMPRARQCLAISLPLPRQVW